MLKRKALKGIIAATLAVISVITVFAPVTNAEEPTPTMPDLSGYTYTVIDGIEPETTVEEIADNTVITDTEQLIIYNSDGIRLFNSDYIGNGTFAIITENDEITEVYRLSVYGDLDGNGTINAADLVDLKLELLETRDAADDTVTDIIPDGELNVLDFIALKKNPASSLSIQQNRIYAYSKRFNWTDSLKASYSFNGYEEAFEDFTIASSDIDLSFSRYYDSNNTAVGSFGIGFTASFEGSCKDYGSNSKIIKIYGQSPIVFELENNEYSCEYSRASLTATETGFAFTGEDGLSYLFNQNGYLVSVSDKNGNTVNITVNSSGKIQRVTDSVGREYTYTYGQNGLVSTVTDCMQRAVSYEYDSLNRLEKVIGVLGTIASRYVYNENNKLVNVYDAFGNTQSTVTYDGATGTVTSVTDSDGVTTGYYYNPEDNSVSIINDGKITEKQVYNQYNRLVMSKNGEDIQRNFYCNRYGDTSVTLNADGSKEKYSYDLNGNVLSVRIISDEEKSTEKNTYDSNNNLTLSISGNEKTSYTYDSNGNTLSVTKYENGEISEATHFTYNNKGLVLTSSADDIITAYTYDSNGYLESELSSDGKVNKTYSHNIIGFTETETDGEKSLSYKYNLNGDVLRKTENNTVLSRTVYDSYGRVRQQIEKSEYNPIYDGLNGEAPVDSYLNNSAEVDVGIRYIYGENGKLIQTKVSSYTIQTNSNQKVTSVTIANTPLATYSYTEDVNELLSGIEYVNGQSISYAYDTNGNLTSLYHGDTLAYSYGYNEDGELTSKINLTENIRTDYTENGETASHINGDGTLTALKSYQNERLVDETFDPFSLTPFYRPAEEDEQADLERLTESFDGKSFTTDYFENNVQYGSVSYKSTKNEDESVNKTEFKSLNKKVLETTYSYNEASLPTSIVHTYNNYTNTYSYTYDGNGNILSETRSDGSSKNYTYDDLGQLIRVDDSWLNSTVVYEYDGVTGNITSQRFYSLCGKDEPLGTPYQGASYSYGIPVWTDLLTAVDGNSISYDALGNIKAYNGYNYTWTAGRHLSQITNGTNTYSYKYDDDGIRTQKTVNGVTTHYTTVDGRITSQYNGTDTFYFRYDENNSLIGLNYNGSEYFYLKNIQGDIDGIINSNGELAVTYKYDAWGQINYIGGGLAYTLGVKNPMRYRGYYYDNETGYYYLQSRYYSPGLCRFICADEPNLISLNGNSIVEVNLFAYCRNNPINLIDVNGYTPIQAVFAAIGAIAGWYLGDYVAKKFGYRSGWKYWTIRTGVVVGGAVLGWFAGGALTSVIKGFIFSSPKLIASTPLWVYKFLGITTGSGTVVLGRYPTYLELAKKLGSNVFSIAQKVWNSMSVKEQWAANKDFLNKAIQSGQKFILSNNAHKAKPGTYFYKEIQYLLSKGYKIAKGGWEMIKK